MPRAPRFVWWKGKPCTRERAVELVKAANESRKEEKFQQAVEWKYEALGVCERVQPLDERLYARILQELGEELSGGPLQHDEESQRFLAEAAQLRKKHNAEVWNAANTHDMAAVKVREMERRQHEAARDEKRRFQLERERRKNMKVTPTKTNNLGFVNLEPVPGIAEGTESEAADEEPEKPEVPEIPDPVSTVRALMADPNSALANQWPPRDNPLNPNYRGQHRASVAPSNQRASLVESRASSVMPPTENPYAYADLNARPKPESVLSVSTYFGVACTECGERIEDTPYQWGRNRRGRYHNHCMFKVIDRLVSDFSVGGVPKFDGSQKTIAMICPACGNPYDGLLEKVDKHWCHRECAPAFRAHLDELNQKSSASTNHTNDQSMASNDEAALARHRPVDDSAEFPMPTNDPTSIGMNDVDPEDACDWCGQTMEGTDAYEFEGMRIHRHCLERVQESHEYRAHRQKCASCSWAVTDGSEILVDGLYYHKACWEVSVAGGSPPQQQQAERTHATSI